MKGGRLRNAAAGITSILILSSCGGGGSSGDAATSATPPTSGSSDITITAAPAAQQVVEGQQVTLGVTAISASPLTYQWQRNGSAIAGATSPAYTTPQLGTTDDGASYAVVVSNGSASQSAAASVRVFSDLGIVSPLLTITAANAPDPAIDTSFGEDYSYLNPTVTAKGKLFVFFAATGGNPSIYRRIEAAAANNGFHSLGLSYPNADPVNTLCPPASGSCPGLIREETLTGDDVSSLVNVNRANSIENRLLKTLQYLDAQHPADGWNRYFDAAGNILWNLIRVGGHSQGGGMAGYIGVERSVDRVCAFSSPADFTLTQPADWLSAPSATAPARFYGFGHLRDDIVPWNNLQKIWAALQMNQFGAAVSVDVVSAPFAGSHMFSTNLDVPANSTGSGFHGMTASDLSTPIDANGLPVYRSVWQVACFL